MLQLLTGRCLACDDYTITHKYNGLDTLSFDLQSDDEDRRLIPERTRIYETTERQTYIVDLIDVSGSGASYACNLDLTDWQREILDNPVDGFAACDEALLSALPTGWEIVNAAPREAQVIMVEEHVTPLQLALDIQEAHLCCMRFDNYAKTVTVIYPEDRTDSGVRFLSSKNLRAKPNFQGKSSDLATRLYPYGKDGLTISDVNDDIEYIENHQYSNEVICAAWTDTSYDDPEALLRDARRKLALMSIPTREWSLEAYDLARIDPETYAGDAVQLHQVVEIYDEDMDTVYTAQITEEELHPNYPESNRFTIRSGWSADSTFRARLEKLLRDKTANVTQTGDNGYWTWIFNKKATTCKALYSQQITLQIGSDYKAEVPITLPYQLSYCSGWDHTANVWFTKTDTADRTKVKVKLDETDGLLVKVTAYKRNFSIEGVLNLSINFVHTAEVGEDIVNTPQTWSTGTSARYLYYNSAPSGRVTVINKNKTAKCIATIPDKNTGTTDNRYVILTTPEGQEYYVAGFTSTSGGVTTITDNSKAWTAPANGAQLYKDSTKKSKLYKVSEGTQGRCYGMIDGVYIVAAQYSTRWIIGLTDVDGGVVI